MLTLTYTGAVAASSVNIEIAGDILVQASINLDRNFSFYSLAHGPDIHRGGDDFMSPSPCGGSFKNFQSFVCCTVASRADHDQHGTHDAAPRRSARRCYTPGESSNGLVRLMKGCARCGVVGQRSSTSPRGILLRENTPVEATKNFVGSLHRSFSCAIASEMISTWMTSRNKTNLVGRVTTVKRTSLRSRPQSAGA